MPKQSDIFQQYMSAIWHDQILDNTGMTVYADEHDAIFIATVFRARPTGAERDEWREWTFADGSTAWINVEGSGTTNEPPDGRE